MVESQLVNANQKHPKIDSVSAFLLFSQAIVAILTIYIKNQ